MGAAGLTCSTCEMGSRGGVGIDIDLDLVPQRETGMTAYEMLLSESQERMLLVADKGREEEVFDVFRKWGLDAVDIGVVTGDGNLRVRHHGRIVAEIPNPALADEAPLYDRPHNVKPHRRAPMEAPRNAGSQDLSAALLEARWPRPISVRSAGSGSSTTTWCAPTPSSGPGSDAAVVRDQGDRHLDRDVARRQRPLLLSRSAARGAKLAVAECCRNLATTGAHSRGRDE